jgi:hypothetical protein
MAQALNMPIGKEISSQKEINIGGPYNLALNGRVRIAFNIPNELLEKAAQSRVDGVELFNSVCATILFRTISELIKLEE